MPPYIRRVPPNPDHVESYPPRSDYQVTTVTDEPRRRVRSFSEPTNHRETNP